VDKRARAKKIEREFLLPGPRDIFVGFACRPKRLCQMIQHLRNGGIGEGGCLIIAQRDRDAGC
jgi:hypothetical protein